MEVQEIIGRGHSCNVFIVQADENFLVDAGMGVSKRILKKAGDLHIDRIILTHRHIDHIGDAEELSEKLEAPLYASEKEAEALREGNDPTVLGRSFGKNPPPLDVNTLEKEKYSGFEILSTPGHTEDSICLYHPEEKILVSGDTVFSNGSVGRSDLPTGDKDELVESVEKLSELEIDSLYPGHMSVVEENASEHIERSLKNIKMI